MEFHVYGQKIKKNPKTQIIKKTPKKSGTILLQHVGGHLLGVGGMSHPGGRKQEGLCDISLWFVQYMARGCAGIQVNMLLEY